MVIEKADVMSVIASISPPVAAPPQSAGATLSGLQSLNTTKEVNLPCKALLCSQIMH